MTVHQQTHQLLRPDDIQEVVAYVQQHRDRTEPFDVAVNGETPGEPGRGAEMVQPYSEAGATWWVELSRETLEANRHRMRQGPPRE